MEISKTKSVKGQRASASARPKKVRSKSSLSYHYNLVKAGDEIVQHLFTLSGRIENAVITIAESNVKKPTLEVSLSGNQPLTVYDVACSIGSNIFPSISIKKGDVLSVKVPEEPANLEINNIYIAFTFTTEE